MLGTITKAGRVLDLFTTDRPEWGVTEVAGELAMPKTNAHALLATLCDIGLLRRSAQGRYRLGWKFMSLSHTLSETTSFRVAAGRRMQQAADRLNKTLHLAVLIDQDIVYLDKRQGPRCEVIQQSGVGRTMSAHCTAVGKVLLAAEQGSAVEIVQRHGLPRRTAHTIGTIDGLERDLELTRRRGFGLDMQESVPNLCCVAVPVLDRRGNVTAAMSISVPLHQYRINPDYYRQTVESIAVATTRAAEFETA